MTAFIYLLIAVALGALTLMGTVFFYGRHRRYYSTLAYYGIKGALVLCAFASIGFLIASQVVTRN